MRILKTLGATVLLLGLTYGLFVCVVLFGGYAVVALIVVIALLVAAWIVFDN